MTTYLARASASVRRLLEMNGWFVLPLKTMPNGHIIWQIRHKYSTTLPAGLTLVTLDDGTQQIVPLNKDTQ